MVAFSGEVEWSGETFTEAGLNVRPDGSHIQESQTKQEFHDNFDILVSGAASLKPQLCSFFSAIGMPVFEGYGMTETSPVIAVSCREKYGREANTVGFPLGGVDVAITKEGEIICRGHNVMMG